MTDTTDIKALREKFETLSQIGDFYYFAKDLLDQLEAERQRADRYHFVAMSALETQAEISEQLGINEDECDGSPEQVHEKIEMLQTELAELKAKLANPVVLPERKKAEFYVDEEFSNKDLAAIYNCAILELKKEIHSAGFTTVKDGQ